MPLAPRGGGQEPSWDSWQENIGVEAASSASAQEPRWDSWEDIAWGDERAWGDVREAHDEVKRDMDLPRWDDAAGCWMETPGVAACNVATDQSYDFADKAQIDKGHTKAMTTEYWELTGRARTLCGQ